MYVTIPQMIEIPGALWRKMTKFERITRSFCYGSLPLNAAKGLAIRILENDDTSQREKDAALAIANAYKKIIAEDASTPPESNSDT